MAAETVIALRREAGWDQADLAAHSGLDIGLIAGVESGHSELPSSALARIARAFGVAVGDLRP